MQEIQTVADFQEKVLKNDKPTLVDFFAPWCGPCKMITPLLEVVSEEKKGQLDIYKLDIDKLPEIATQHMIRSIPALLIFKDGKEIAKQIGAVNKNVLNKWVDENI